jgi:hypothetical protein
MGRRIGAVVAGLAGSVALIMAVQAVGTWLYPPPPGTDFTDPEAVAALMAEIPLGALLMVELSYAAGSLGGGAIVRLVTPDRTTVLASAWARCSPSPASPISRPSRIRSGSASCRP